MTINNPCPQCPWRTANQGKKHFASFYSKKNLTRLWNQIRRGGGEQSCHLTDPSHPAHIRAGASKDAVVKECPGSVILVMREMDTMASMSADPSQRRIDDQAVMTYLRERKGGLTKSGILYWCYQRLHLSGVPRIGGPKLPEVNIDDTDIGLPTYLKAEENI